MTDNDQVARVAKMLKRDPPGGLSVRFHRGEFSVMAVMGHEMPHPPDYVDPIDRLGALLDDHAKLASLSAEVRLELQDIFDELDSPGMVGGAAHGLDEDLVAALEHALGEAGC